MRLYDKPEEEGMNMLILVCIFCAVVAGCLAYSTEQASSAELWWWMIDGFGQQSQYAETDEIGQCVEPFYVISGDWDINWGGWDDMAEGWDVNWDGWDSYA